MAADVGTWGRRSSSPLGALVLAALLILGLGGYGLGAATHGQRRGAVYPFHCHILTHLMNPGQAGEEMGALIVLVKYTA